MPYEHLRLGREAPQTERHRRQDRRPRYAPADPRAHGAMLGQRLTIARQQAATEDVGGFDDRKLLKIRLRPGDTTVPEFGTIPGIEIISQEDRAVILAFASEQGLGEFESRLASLARDGTVTRKELLYAIQDFDHWTAQDRTGAALRAQGFPAAEAFALDVELWPQPRHDRQQLLLRTFLGYLRELGVEALDQLDQASLLMVRVRCSRSQAEQLLRHRDVRTVDLPPRLGVSVEMLLADINRFPAVAAPPDGAPAIAVLDSGLTPGHELLRAAVGDAQGYLAPQRSPDDTAPHRHGSFVAGLALYGDVQAQIARGQFIARLRLFSGKVFEDDDRDQSEFVEKAVEDAVRDLHSNYGCRVFNLSYGDRNKIYDGRHLRGLAYTLDRLTRELGVLFVVPAGNLRLDELPANARDTYPDYLLEDHARLLDPATALNALTVGGLSLNEATRDAQRHPDAIEQIVLARASQPFPLTRCGPSINAAIKPDVVEHAGNVALSRSGSRPRHAGLGVVSLNGGFAEGLPFKEDIGTSYAAPQVAHKAASLLAEFPGATPNVLRALIAAHARWPQACMDLLDPANTEQGREKLLRLTGYGRVDDSALFRSLDHTVSLLAEERIANNHHHFYELPLPDEFWAGTMRTREISVALAYTPAVRTTRLDYRSAKLWFTLVNAADLDTVTQAFRRNREEGMGERTTGRWLSNQVRKGGTLQVSRWTFKRAPDYGDKVYLVVTRQDSVWSTESDHEEPYALAVVVSDRENAYARLYAELRAALEARLAARARARV